MRKKSSSLIPKLYFALTMIIISGFANASSVQQDKAENLPLAYEGYTGIYDGFTLKLDERFDDFDNTAWVTGDGAVGEESACRFQPQGVEVAGGLLNLVIRKEPIEAGWSEDHQKEKWAYDFSCGELRSHNSKRVRYGRFETRMKAPARAVASGYISSLFTYNFEGEQPEWEEIDVELEGGRPDKFQANLIYGKNTWAWSGTRQWGAWESIRRIKAIFPENKDFRSNLITPFSSCFSKNTTNIYCV
jgi:endo-1,3-1,4-beta-glycanase ExoK